MCVLLLFQRDSHLFCLAAGVPSPHHPPILTSSSIPRPFVLDLRICIESKLISGKEGTIPPTLAICHYITHAINHLLGIPTWDTAHTQFISEPSANPSEIVLTNYNCNEWHLSQYCKSPILQRNRFVDVFLLKHIS